MILLLTEIPTGSGSNSHSSSLSATRVPFPQERKDLYDRVSKDAVSPVFKRTIPPPNHQGFAHQAATTASAKAGLRENPAMSFVMLTESQVVPPRRASGDRSSSPSKTKTRRDGSDDQKQSLSHQIESTTRLFEILSSRSDIDHPICTECSDLLLSSLQARLSASVKERDAYISYLKNLNNIVPTPSEISKAKSSLASARSAESSAFSELLSLEHEKATLDAELAALEVESLALDGEEDSFWRSHNAFTHTLSSFQNDCDALNAAYDHDARQLERLQRTNVYNDTFCIGHDGFFGTINGLRLGRLPPPQNVDWAEINGAWGNACLLLATVAEKLGFVFRGYRLKPMGSTSRIEKIDLPSPSSPSTTLSSHKSHAKVTSLDLYSSGDLALARMILHRRIDLGMVAFLECVRQLGAFVETGGASAKRPSSPSSPSQNRNSNVNTEDTGGLDRERGIKLPYKIHGDKIDDTSIKLAVSQDEAWTRACKYTLTCCKFLLAHASNVRAAERKSAGGK